MTKELPTIEEAIQQDMKDQVGLEEISELEAPIRSIIEKARENFDRGDYDLIIGIDASGRIPALIISGFIKHIYSKRGFDEAKIRFIAGSGDSKSLEKQIEGWQPQKRVLIVDDTIVSGSSISPLCQALKRKNISFDIVSVGMWTGDINSIREDLGAQNIYWGMENVPPIYGKNSLSGVFKNRFERRLFAYPYKEHLSVDWQEDFNQSRKDVKVLVGKIIKWYESKDNE